MELIADTKFKVPNNGNTYFLAIKERCINLIKSNIWAGIELDDLELWIKNFKSEEEKYFAACVLDSLIYRSKSQTKSMIFELLSRKLPDLFRLNSIPISQEDLLSLKNKVDKKIRFTSVLPVVPNNTESGHEILRQIRQGHCNEKWIINASDIHRCISEGIHTFIFVDDFLGTGEQFFGCCAQHSIFPDKLKNVNIVFAPLVAHQSGIEFIEKKLPKTLITSVDYFTNMNSFFDEYFTNDGNTPESAKLFYIDLLKRIGNINPKAGKTFGNGDLGMTYAFENGIPNNSLQILYYDQTWSPLFKR